MTNDNSLKDTPDPHCSNGINRASQQIFMESRNVWIRLGLNGAAPGDSTGMVMFSQLRRFDVTDEQGQRARLTDLGVALLDADYPSCHKSFFP